MPTPIVGKRRELQAATSAAEVAEILKRTVLVAYPRADVAALSGSAWCRWLAETIGKPLPAPIAEALTAGVFSRRTDVRNTEVTTFAVDWIRNHRRQTPQQPSGWRSRARTTKESTHVDLRSRLGVLARPSAAAGPMAAAGSHVYSSPPSAFRFWDGW